MTTKEMQKLYKKASNAVADWKLAKEGIERATTIAGTLTNVDALRKACKTVEKLADCAGMFTNELAERVSTLDEDGFIVWCITNGYHLKKWAEPAEATAE